MSARGEKGGGSFQGIKLLLCENPLPPIARAIAAAQAEVPLSNYYTEPFSAPLRKLISARLGSPVPLSETRTIESLQPGRGRCGFVVVSACKAA
jgi:histidinol-phosphate/aromatic aminotransferase/cobyric acid decarboxylase-like protein